MTHEPRLAIFPGSFDPLTNGHADVVRRAVRLFDRLVVAVLVNPDKRPLFDTGERVAMLREAFADLATVEVDTFEGLLVDYAARRRAVAIVRGVRTAADYDYEMQMALMNRHLRPEFDTVFLAASEPFTYVSSRLVREVASLGGPVDALVPEAVQRRFAARRARDTGRAL